MKKKRKKILISITIVCFIIVVIILYAFYVEPGRLVTRNIILEREINNPVEKFKIVQFSDTHLGKGFTLKQLEKAVDTINEQEADFVVFTGDLMDSAFNYTKQEEACQILSKIQGKMGKIAVWGNHDIGGGGIRVYEQIMENSGFVVLKNDTITIPMNGDRNVIITGLDDGMLGSPDVSIVLQQKRKEDFYLVVSHEPDIIDNMNHSQVDLTLSGHSHGGQIMIPLIGPLVRVPLAKIYTHGLYELENGKIYVNTGLGTTKINARLFNPPSISVFHIEI